MQEEDKTCKNCETEFVGTYCNSCGQKSIEERFTLRKVLTEAVTKIFKLDNGLWHTIITLTLRPATLINNYIGGKTKSYTAPIQYLIIASAVYIFVSYTTNTVEIQMEGAIKFNEFLGLEIDEKEREELDGFYEFVFKNILFLFLVIIPFISLASFWVMKKRKLNYAEHLILNAYLTAHQTILTIPFLIILFFIPSLGGTFLLWMTIGYFGYYIFVFKYFFQKSWMGAINYGSLVYTFGFILTFLFLFPVVYLIGYLFGHLLG